MSGVDARASPRVAETSPSKSGAFGRRLGGRRDGGGSQREVLKFLGSTVVERKRVRSIVHENDAPQRQDSECFG